MWQATPAPATSTRSQTTSWSQSTRASRMASVLPLSSPFRHRRPRDLLQKCATPRIKRELERLCVHPGEHQHVARLDVGNDGGNQAVGINLG